MPFEFTIFLSGFSFASAWVFIGLIVACDGLECHRRDRFDGPHNDATA